MRGKSRRKSLALAAAGAKPALLTHSSTVHMVNLLQSSLCDCDQHGRSVHALPWLECCVIKDSLLPQRETPVAWGIPRQHARRPGVSSAGGGACTVGRRRPLKLFPVMTASDIILAINITKILILTVFTRYYILASEIRR
jgi:hypothetical protein